TLAAERETEVTLNIVKPAGASCPGQRDVRQAFSEDAAWAAVYRTPPPSCPDCDADEPPLPG
ncbi:hypothetical protein P7D22_14815, partial [Lichenihabitans sp. Uapishka_5]|uniref:hypothetical protein n=1 Tax=Lichenihabitans sp. Uapishka_5 TaxID=3037302 RepID=UPI0029E7EC54